MAPRKAAMAWLIWCLAAVAVGALPLASAKAVRNTPTTPVSTDCGPVVGVTDGAVDSFLGIPFAAPPLGKRRWMPPESLAKSGMCWQGTFNASSNGSQCAQLRSGKVTGSEDCLFLDVWAPATQPQSVPPTGSHKKLLNNGGDLLPVMVYIYGGSLINGGAQLLQLGPLAATGKVVVVAMNYRVQGLGFLALPQLSQGDPRGTSGNYGFLDQQEALRWVQRNIAAFGGDPSQVTVFGQSSGGTSIFGLLSSPASRGLFRAAIALSGSPNMTASLEFAYRQNAPFVDAADCQRPTAAEVTACLRELTTDEVFAKLPTAWLGSASGSQFGLPNKVGGERYPAYAVVDGVTVAKPVLEALAEPVVDVAFMVGNMAQEPDMVPDRVVFNYTSNQWTALVHTIFDPFGPTVANTAMRMYAGDAAVNPQKAYDSMCADMRVACGSIELATAAAASFQSPVYSYVNVYEPSAPVELSPELPYKPRYSFHMLDLIAGVPDWSVFHDFPSKPAPPAYHPSTRDQAYGAMIRGNWLDLAAHGKLTGANAAAWPTADSASGFPATITSAVLNLTASAVDGVRAAQCAFWKAHGMGQGYWWTN